MFEEIPRPGLWKRLLHRRFLVIFAAAAATSVAAFHEVDKVVNALKRDTRAEARQDSSRAPTPASRRRS